MNNSMYKLDPSSPRPEPVTLTEDDKKIVSLESKVNRLVEQVTRLQTDYNQLSKIVRRQNGDITNLLSRVNRLK